MKKICDRRFDFHSESSSDDDCMKNTKRVIVDKHTGVVIVMLS